MYRRQRQMCIRERDILDSFGHRSVRTFSNFGADAAMPARHCQFTPPKGADVLRNLFLNQTGLWRLMHKREQLSNM